MRVCEVCCRCKDERSFINTQMHEPGYALSLNVSIFRRGGICLGNSSFSESPFLGNSRPPTKFETKSTLKVYRDSIASDVVKVEGEDPAPPGCLREDRVKWYVGDSQSWVRIPWLAREETPGP